MSQTLENVKIAILVTDGFEQSEMAEPRRALDEAMAETTLVSLKAGQIRAWSHADWGDSFDVELVLADAKPENFDGLLLPGGVFNPDKLRMDEHAVAFVKRFADAGKPIAAICHGPWTLINAGAVKGKTLTSWPSLQEDLRNAGAKWIDQDCVVDGNLVTSRKPDDIPAFNAAIINLFAPKVAVSMIMTDPVM